MQKKSGQQRCVAPSIGELYSTYMFGVGSAGGAIRYMNF